MKLNEMLNVKWSYFDSAIPQMQRMLNSDKKKKIEILMKISYQVIQWTIISVNPYHWDNKDLHYYILLL